MLCIVASATGFRDAESIIFKRGRSVASWTFAGRVLNGHQPSNILKRNIGLPKYDSTSATCVFINTQCFQSTIRNLVFKFICRLN